MIEEGSNKRIVKNTIFLYFRSFLMMAINLFSSRVILQALGVEDYGLYGAIGSIVAMFTMINGVLAAGTSRFLTFELGKGDKERLRKTFSASFAMHVALAIILLLLLETAGLWFVNNKMNIPDGREFAANVVYQLSIMTCMLTLTQVPYSASIISHEKMSVYAYVGIAEATFKLALIFALLYIPFADNLIAYAIIIAVWSIGLQIWYRFYCRKRFEESNLMIVRDKSIYKGMLSYSLWDFFGQFCSTGNSQGINILINMFFGVKMNAARAIAYQVETAVTQFSSNFMTAVQPQIVKSYAATDYKRFFQLIYQGGKYAFFLLFIVSLPLLLETDYILSIWLVNVPPKSALFLRFTLVIALMRIPLRTIIMGVHATGNVKVLNLTAGLEAGLTFLPIVYICYKIGLPVWTCFLVKGLNDVFISSYLEMRSLKLEINFSMWDYCKNVMIKSVAICLIPFVISLFPVFYFKEGFPRFVLTGVVSVATTSLCIYFLGLTAKEKSAVFNFVKSKLTRKP